MIRDFAGKVAFITGGASGIGLALGRALAEAGCRVMLADIEEAALTDAVGSLKETGQEIRGVACDVTDPASVECAAEQAVAAFRNVHILCNNAGVAGGSGTDTISLDSWRWVIDVNLMGVVHGLRAFLPHIRAHGEGGHIVNTASMAGMLSGGGMGLSPYSASKYAVVAISEGLRAELEPHSIGVTVLCPGYVRTRIVEAARNRQPRYGRHVATRRNAAVTEMVNAGIDPQTVAARVLAAIRDDELYCFTHPDYRPAVEDRFAAILAAFAKLDRVER